MSYEDSKQCKLLATHCVCCGRPLVDACSVELGIGPECRNGIYPEDVDEADRKIANEHVFNAALASDRGSVEEVLEYADLVPDYDSSGLDIEETF